MYNLSLHHLGIQGVATSLLVFPLSTLSSHLEVLMWALQALLLIIAVAWKSATWSSEGGLYLVLVGSGFTLIVLALLCVQFLYSSCDFAGLATLVRHLVTLVSSLAPAGI